VNRNGEPFPIHNSYRRGHCSGDREIHVAFVVWTCNGNIRSYSAAAYWNTFEAREEAEKFAADHPDCSDDSIPEVGEDPQMLPGKQGAFGEYPETPEDYEAFSPELPIAALLQLWKWEKRGGGEWGHVPHWVSACLAAYADGNDEKARKCLAIAFGYKDALRGAEREELFHSSSLLGWDDLHSGSRLIPAASMTLFKE
jgi:hypothetical protein